MKHLLLLLSSFVILHSSFAQSLALDLFDGNDFSQVDVPTGANALLGFDANGLPVRVTAGTGITISGNVITSSGGSGGTWGTIAGTITNQTDLMSLFNLKAPILNPTFTGAVTIPAGGTIYGGMNFFITASGGLVMTDTVDDDLVASAWQIRDEDNALTAEMLTDGTLTATSFVGNGNALTFLNANNLDGALPAINGFLLTDLNATQLTSGTVPAARMPALTGDVTTSAGAVATTIANGAVTNAKLAGSIDLTTKVTGILPPANMGTGSSITTKYLRGDGTWQTISGGGDALVSGSLDQFADVTQTATKTFAITESTTLAGGTHSGTNTGDQTTITGNAGTATALQTGRTINGTSFDGTANITITAAAGTLTGSTLASGVTASSLTSAAGGTFGTAAFTAATAYEVPLTFGTGLTRTTNTITVNTSQSLSTLSNLTSNGFVKTSGGTGALSIDTATYQVSDADLDDLADGSLTGTLVAAASTSARGSVELATDGETAGSVAVQGNDTRLVNAGKVEIGVAISDETTAITTGTAKITFRMPSAMTLTAVRLSLTTVSSSGTPTVDINESGTTVLSTKLSCDASEKTSTTAATAAVISDSALADDAEITIDIDTAGTGATGAKVWLIGTR